MKLFDRVEWYYKLAQETTSPHQILKSVIQNIIKTVESRPHASAEEKGDLLKVLKEATSNGEPDGNVDATWSAKLAKLMDQVNSLRGDEDQKDQDKVGHDVFHTLEYAWKHIESCGHKAHVQKPVGTSKLGK